GAGEGRGAAGNGRNAGVPERQGAACPGVARTDRTRRRVAPQRVGQDRQERATRPLLGLRPVNSTPRWVGGSTGVPLGTERPPAGSVGCTEVTGRRRVSRS